MKRCRAKTIRMTDPSHDFTLAICEVDCGYWAAEYRGGDFDGGNDGIYSEDLERMQSRLREDARDDLADHLQRIQIALELV